MWYSGAVLARHLTPALLASLGDSPVTLLVGARQTGKSTLVQSLAGGRHPAEYLTFDDAAVLAAASTDPAGFVAGLRGPVVLDEVQHVPGLFPALKATVDRDRRPGRFLLTGLLLTTSVRVTVRQVHRDRAFEVAQEAARELMGEA